MVRFSKIATFGTVLLSASTVSAAVATSNRLTQRGEELRLVKTSDDDAGTWMTEDEKFDNLISKHVGFVDVTDTQELEMFHLNNIAGLEKRLAVPAIPTAPTHQTEANALIANANQANLQSWVTSMSNFYNRYYNGQYSATSAEWVFTTAKSVASTNAAITVKQFTHSFNQPSVIATIPGNSTEVVIVSCHIDSVGTTRTGRAPGADDNASGTVVVMESLRVLAAAKYKPENTLEFHFYAGEEGGLLGSRDVMQSYKSSSVNVIATLNTDMTGYSPNNVIGVLTDYVDATLTAFVQKLVPVYTTLKAVTSKCGYGCSDHASATAAGYRAAFVFEDTFEDSSPYIHSESDTISTVSFPHVLQHAKLTIGFLVEASYF